MHKEPTLEYSTSITGVTPKVSLSFYCKYNGQELRFARGPHNYMFQKLIFTDRYSILTTSARLPTGFILHSVLQNGIEKWHHSQEIGVPENRPFSFFSTP